MAHRTAYDRQMLEMYDPMKIEGYTSYHSPPWPGQRVGQDVKLQQKYCPDCKGLPTMDFEKPGGRWCPSCPGDSHGREQYEGYAPVFGFRTKADIALQDKWCPTCKCQPNAQCICPDGPANHPYPRNKHMVHFLPSNGM